MRRLISLTLTLLIMIVVIYHIKIQPPLPPIESPVKHRIKTPSEITFDQAVAEVSETNLRKHMEYLCSQQLEGRMSGKQGNKMAAVYLEQQYSSYGLKTKRQKFNIQRMNPGPKQEEGDDFTENVIAWVEGTDPAYKDEVMVVGAHFDHIGYGPNMSQARGKIAIHPGADDNASGTVVLLEIARAYGRVKSKVKRTTVFISFSGEEMGLIGSRHYCNNPIFPLNNPSISKHIFMLNMDMVSRLSKNTSEIEETGKDIAPIVQELNGKYSFARSITSSGSGGSDHASFADKQVPVCILHTGMHKDYHTPDDTADKINYGGMTQIAKYATELSWRIGQTQQKGRQ